MSRDTDEEYKKQYMKYLQIVATIACAALLVIAWQLQGMRPLHYSEIDRLIERGQNEEAWKKLRDAPVVTIGGILSKVEVDVVNTPDVNIDNASPIEVQIKQ